MPDDDCQRPDLVRRSVTRPVLIPSRSGCSLSPSTCSGVPHGRVGWHAHSRHDPVRGGHVVHPGARVARCGCREGRGARVRRSRPGRRTDREPGLLLLFLRVERQQAQHRAEPAHGRRARVCSSTSCRSSTCSWRTTDPAWSKSSASPTGTSPKCIPASSTPASRASAPTAPMRAFAAWTWSRRRRPGRSRSPVRPTARR